MHTIIWQWILTPWKHIMSSYSNNISWLCLIPNSIYRIWVFQHSVYEVSSGTSHICYSPLAPTQFDLHQHQLTPMSDVIHPNWVPMQGCATHSQQFNSRILKRVDDWHPPISVPNQHDTAYQKTKSKKYCTRNDDVNKPKWHIALYGKTICIKILQVCKNDDDPLSCAPLRSCGIPAGE